MIRLVRALAPRDDEERRIGLCIAAALGTKGWLWLLALLVPSLAGCASPDFRDGMGGPAETAATVPVTPTVPVDSPFFCPNPNPNPNPGPAPSPAPPASRGEGSKSP